MMRCYIRVALLTLMFGLLYVHAQDTDLDTATPMATPTTEPEGGAEAEANGKIEPTAEGEAEEGDGSSTTPKAKDDPSNGSAAARVYTWFLFATFVGSIYLL